MDTIQKKSINAGADSHTHREEHRSHAMILLEKCKQKEKKTKLKAVRIDSKTIILKKQ